MKENPLEIQLANTLPNDYKTVLIDSGITEFKSIGYYYQVGNIELPQGWIIHISIIRQHFLQLLQNLIPYLIIQKIPFKIPLNIVIHSKLLDGLLGYENLGKIISLYPHNQSQLPQIVNELLQMSNSLKGPSIPTDVHLGNIIYARYGSFNYTSNIEERFIYDNNGHKIRDEYTYPFKPIFPIPWPFENIKPPTAESKTNILNGAYLIRKTIKSDVKGAVYLALYQKGFSIKKCIIKQGKMAMATDDFNRDMTDRLLWQKTIHDDLASKIPLPKVIDYFFIKGDAYLVMKYINGETLGKYVGMLANGNSWISLKKEIKLIIVNKLIDIINILINLHNNGYYHRDLNIDNFMIDNNGKIYLIDMELCYNFTKKIPNPPYTLGTIGYMSPEQSQMQPPTAEQDIFGIGALLLVAIVRISPYKYNSVNNEFLFNCLNFLTNDNKISELITNCLNNKPKCRPSLQTIKITVENLKHTILKDRPQHEPISIQNLEMIISDAVLSLTNSRMLSNDGYWTSTIEETNKQVGNIGEVRAIYLDFFDGIGGIIYLFCLIKQHTQIDIKNYYPLLINNWDLITSNILNEEKEVPLGLYFGKSGISLCIKSMIDAGLADEFKVTPQYLTDCLKEVPDGIDMANGLAGYGIALMKNSSLLPKDFLQKNLKYTIENLLKFQSGNGSWNINKNELNYDSSLGFSYGVTGICYFLLEYAFRFEDTSYLEPTLKSLDWLQQHLSSNSAAIFSRLFLKKKNIIENIPKEAHLIILIFIRAYQVTKIEKYKNFAENLLFQYPPQIVKEEIDQHNGLSGLGGIYIEAYKVFDNKEWLIRAEWIINFLTHTRKGIDQDSYWLQVDPNTPIANLMNGNGGIIYFFLQYLLLRKNISISPSPIT